MRRRLILAGALVVSLVVCAVVALGAGSDEDGDYYVRAIFDNASFVIPGEDVKVAGVTAGAIDSLDLQPDNKAVVVLNITDPAFRPFRKDATCRIALQSLIGEQFIECEPTQRRGEGVPAAAVLPEIEDGPGKGQHLLPVQNTSSPVGVDLINNIMRLPERERFRLIFAEFGAGLAGNGKALRDAIRRANPAIRQFDRWVAILAQQDRLLGRLVDASDEVLEPFARRRKEFGGFIQHVGEVAAATAERGEAFEQNWAKFPAFLRELRPAMQRFGALSDQMTPALQALDSQARAVNETTIRFGPFTEAAGPALKTLGDLSNQGRKTFPKIEPLIDDTAELGSELRPTAKSLGNLFASFDDEGGIEQLMRFIYFYTGSVNGEDAQGHYLRSAFEASNCSARESEPAFGCESNFDTSGEGDETESTTSAVAAAANSNLRELTASPLESRDPADEANATPSEKADTVVLDYLLGQETP